MHGLLAAAGAELLQLKTIRRVTAVLRRDVVTLLALSVHASVMPGRMSALLLAI